MRHLHHWLSGERGEEPLAEPESDEGRRDTELISEVNRLSRQTPASAHAIGHDGGQELRSLFQFDNREMPAAGEMGHDHLKMLAALSTHSSSRSCTGRSSWPSLSWLIPNTSRSRDQAEIDLIRRGSLQGAVRSMAVVPLDEEADLPPECCPIQGHEDAPQRLALRGPHEPLGH